MEQRFSTELPQPSNQVCAEPNFFDTGSSALPRTQLYDSSKGEVRSTSETHGGFWSGQSVYQHAPPPPQDAVFNRNMFNHPVQTDWSAIPPRMEHGRQDFRFRTPYPQHHPGFNFGAQSTAVQEFNPTRPPPPFFEGYDRYDERRLADSYPQLDFNYMHHQGSLNSWQRGNSRSQTQIEAHRFNRPFDELSQARSGSRQNQPGFRNTGNDLYQRQKNVLDVFSENAAENRCLADQETSIEVWLQGQRRGDDAGEIKHSKSQIENTQRRADEQWLLHFLLNRKRVKSPTPKVPDGSRLSVSRVRETLYSAARLVSEISLTCQELKRNVENEGVWTETYTKAMALKNSLQEQLKMFSDSACIDRVKREIDLLRKRRARIRRKKQEWVEEKEEKEGRTLLRVEAIDRWRMKRIQEVEEKKRELELRQAADSVLSEVRKKQADSKRMLDILRALEKLRKLRKEAAGRKGIFPEKEADEVFEDHVERLRKLIRKRTAVYGAEEKALRVMLEGEQEEERKREQEKRQKKEREKLLQRRREVEAVLFGDEMAPDHPLQPFRQCYSQAENSLHALVHIRRDWDRFLVPADRPDGSFIPQGWVLPDPPSDEVWATALEKQDSLAD